LALIAVLLLVRYAPADPREQRKFDFTGAAILTSGLGALAWALGQIGPDKTAAAGSLTIAAVIVVGLAALAGFAFWERTTTHPMTPPRLTRNRIFVGLNIATLLIYAALSIMFFLVSFDLVDRRGLTSTDAGLAFLPFTLGVGVLSQPFGALADKVGARAMLIAGPLGVALAMFFLAFGKTTSLTLGVILPMTLLGVSFAVLVAPLTASVLASVTEADQGLASGINNAASRVAQLTGIALSAGVASYAMGYQAGLIVAAILAAVGAIVMAAMLPPERRTLSSRAR
jgi:predicted MFS family arabinose efflux permease